MSNATLAELNAILEQKGHGPCVWDLRGDEVWVQHIVSGGVDDSVYDYKRVGTVDETRQMLQGIPQWKPPVPGYCPRCASNSSNLNIHNCQYIFTIRAEEARRSGDHAKVTEIIATARAQGIEILGHGWENYQAAK